MPANPTISVVTPVLNRHDTIAAAIDSVVSQSVPALEHIVVDGGSRDGTLEALARYPHLAVSSGLDAGIYDALNKAIAKARGDLIVHLNADDLLAPQALAAVIAAARNNPSADVICGGAMLVDMAGNRVADLTAPRFRKGDFDAVLLGSPIINARIFRRSVYERVGQYDTRFPLLADRDFLVRARLAGIVSAEIDTALYVYRQHPASATFDAEIRNAAVMSEEFLRLAAHWLRRSDAPAALRRVCKIRYGRSVVTLARIGAARGGRRDALFLTPNGRISPMPAAYAAMAALAWLRGEPYARS
jgi:glycosyltransferase involved in cell wall biosynthesis